MAEENPCLCLLSHVKQMGNQINWQVEWVAAVVVTIEVIVHRDQGIVQGEVQRKLRVPNLRFKVLMMVGSLIQLVIRHVQEEVAVSAHSDLYYLPPCRHSLMTSFSHLYLRGCANLQVLELLVHTVLWMVLSKCLYQNWVLVIGHWGH